MNRFLLLILTIFLCSCTSNTANKDQKISEMIGVKEKSIKNEWNYKEVKKEFLDSLMIDICSTKDIEFKNLYSRIDSIVSDKNEKLILVDLLKVNGFQVINSGRGNWMEGPRIVSFTMSNRQCECQIDKLYYSTEQENKYKVTERIKCKKTSE